MNVSSVPDPPEIRLRPNEAVRNNTDKPGGFEWKTIIDVDGSVDLGAYIEILDKDHCCDAAAPDESAAFLVYAPQIYLYAESPSCFWATGEPTQTYPQHSGGWVTPSAGTHESEAFKWRCQY